MKNLILILGLAMLIPARASWAQVAAPGDSGVSMGHVHFLVPDVEAAAKFWTAMGGIPDKALVTVSGVPAPLTAPAQSRW